jgi:hypothetical protein
VAVVAPQVVVVVLAGIAHLLLVSHLAAAVQQRVLQL